MHVPRWLALAGPGEERGWATNLTAFRRLVLTHMAVRTFLLLPSGSQAGGFETSLGWTTILVGALGCIVPGAALLATRVAIPLIVADIWIELPEGANHVAVELGCLFLLGLFDERKPDEARLLLPGLRWFIATLFFYTGFQKLVYGYYFQGQFLAFMTGTEERFAALFRFFMPAEELERLQSYNATPVRPGVMAPRLGAGPYIVDSLLFKLLSNGVYVFEMVAGALLIVPRTRAFAALAGVAFVVLIEVGARELIFGFLMTNLLLLFVPGGWIRRLYPFFAAAYLYLVAHELGWVPLFPYSPA